MSQSDETAQSEIRKACRDRLPDGVRDALVQEIRDLVLDAYRQGREEAIQDIARTYREGRSAGFRAGVASAQGLDVALVRELLKLCHPDLHPPWRVEKATRVTQRLLALLD